MYQKIVLVGNLGRDPEMRYTPDGTPVTSFSIASPTGEGITNPVSFSRIRRCTLVDSFRIV